MRLNQLQNGGSWVSLGVHDLAANVLGVRTPTNIEVNNKADGKICIDAFDLKYLNRDPAKTIDNIDPEFSTKGECWIGTGAQGVWGPNYGVMPKGDGSQKAFWKPEITSPDTFDRQFAPWMRVWLAPVGIIKKN